MWLPIHTLLGWIRTHRVACAGLSRFTVLKTMGRQRADTMGVQAHISSAARRKGTRAHHRQGPWVPQRQWGAVHTVWTLAFPQSCSAARLYTQPYLFLLARADGGPQPETENELGDRPRSSPQLPPNLVQCPDTIGFCQCCIDRNEIFIPFFLDLVKEKLFLYSQHF